MIKDTQSRSWIMTQDASKITFEELQLALIDYVYIGQLERGEQGGESGYLHYQIYIENPSAIRFSTLKAKLPNCHLEQRKGTRKQAYDYVTKELTRIGEIFGNGEIDLVDNKGKRNDLLAMITMLENGASMDEIRDIYKTQFLLYQSRLKSYKQNILESVFKDTFRNLTVTYIHGTTGRGKTRFVMEKYGYSNVCRITNYANPFDAYDNQPCIIFEEFRSSLKIEQMLNYLDGYPVTLPARYGDKTACYDKVYIISNIPLSSQYTNIQTEQPETYKAFLRRIGHIWNYDKHPEPIPRQSSKQLELIPVTGNGLPF